MQKAANKHISHSAQNLLDYLSEISGKKIITGQHTQTNPMEEIDYIYEQTGKYPALRGFELLGYSPNINYNDASAECLTEVYENQNTLDTALEWAKKTNGIVTFTFHWFSPIGGRDKSFYTEHTDFDAEKVLIPGTRERDAFYHDMDIIAKELRRFQLEDIPVLGGCQRSCCCGKALQTHVRLLYKCTEHQQPYMGMELSYKRRIPWR